MPALARRTRFPETVAILLLGVAGAGAADTGPVDGRSAGSRAESSRPAAVVPLDPYRYYPGVITVLETRGTAELLAAPDDQNGLELEPRSEFSAGGYVRTGRRGEVIFVLANGTVVILLSESEVRIDRSDLLPYDAPDVVLGELKEEPSASQTRLTMGYGRLILEAKELQESSRFDVTTSFGTFRLMGDEHGFGTAVYVNENTERPFVSIWAGNIDLVLVDGHRRIVNDDHQLRFPRGMNPVLVKGMPWSNVKAFENHLLPARIRLSKVLLKPVGVRSDAAE